VKIGIVLIILQEIVLALKLSPKNKDCLGHRSKIKYRIRLSQYRKSNRFKKILKNRLITPIITKSYNYLQQKLMLKIQQNAISTLCLKADIIQKKLVSILYIQKRDHPVLPKSSLTENMVQVVLSSAVFNLVWETI
jgi:hypothetical protein